MLPLSWVDVVCRVGCYVLCFVTFRVLCLVMVCAYGCDQVIVGLIFLWVMWVLLIFVFRRRTLAFFLVCLLLCVLGVVRVFLVDFCRDMCHRFLCYLFLVVVLVRCVL